MSGMPTAANSRPAARSMSRNRSSSSWRGGRITDRSPAGSASAADLPFAPDDVLLGGELAEAHRAAGVELLGRDADLGPEPELLAVDEPGRRVDKHRGRLDLAGE